MKEIKVKVAGLRIDQFLSTELDVSRSKIQKLISEDKVLVNDNIVSANYKIKENDLINIDNELDFEINILAEDIFVDIVFEDKDLMVINKKSGMVTHPGSGNYTGTLVNALLHKLDHKNEKIRPGIVHRLDKDTSGLMVVAKNEKTLELLSEMIKNRLIERKYLALVEGIFNHQTGTIDAPIGRDANDKLKMSVTNVNSKQAVTHFRVLETFKNKSLIECKLETGRTHQIRVHMKYINHPIYNDPVYGTSKHTSEFGQFLHSKSIRFIHPITKEEIFFEVEEPEEFTLFLDSLRNE